MTVPLVCGAVGAHYFAVRRISRRKIPIAAPAVASHRSHIFASPSGIPPIACNPACQLIEQRPL
jgi:hypothetical protein